MSGYLDFVAAKAVDAPKRGLPVIEGRIELEVEGDYPADPCGVAQLLPPSRAA